MKVTNAIDAIADTLEQCGLSVAKNRNEPISGFPAAILAVESMSPSAFGSITDATVSITVMASRADRVDAWERMWSFLDDNYLADAVDTCDCVAGVVSIDNIGADIEYNDTVALGFVVNVSVAL